MMTATPLSAQDLAVDRELSLIAESFRFLVELNPIDLVEARDRFNRDGRPPRFEYRPLGDRPAEAARRLSAVPIHAVEDAMVASLLLAKQRELHLQLEMLACRGSEGFLALSTELYGAVGPALLEEAEAILATVPVAEPDEGPWLDADAFVEAAELELAHYRAIAPALASRVEVRDESTGIMVSNGDVLIAPTVRIAAARVGALLHHEIGTHVVTHVNGAHQPLQILASGLAGHDETQEGLAVLAEHLVGDLTGDRLRQLAARVVAVHQLIEGASFPDVHRGLVHAGVSLRQAFTITTRVFRSGGLTKDAVYLRGLGDLVSHLASGGDLEVLWLGKMPLTAAPLVADLHERGLLTDPVLRPRYLEDPAARARLTDLTQVTSLVALIGDNP